MRPLSSSCYVVAAEPSRFLCRDSKNGRWVVTLNSARAHAFDTWEEAERARQLMERQTGHIHSAPTGWKIYEMKTRTTFREV